MSIYATCVHKITALPHIKLNPYCMSELYRIICATKGEFLPSETSSCKLNFLTWCTFHLLLASVSENFCSMSMKLNFQNQTYWLKHLDQSCWWNWLFVPIFFFCWPFLWPLWRHHLVVTVIKKVFLLLLYKEEASYSFVQGHYFSWQPSCVTSCCYCAPHMSTVAALATSTQ